MSFRAALLAPLDGQVPRAQGLLLTAFFFGIAHWDGMPYGVTGVLMSGILGWLPGKSMLETRGFFWAWFIHFTQQQCAAGSCLTGGTSPKDTHPWGACRPGRALVGCTLTQGASRWGLLFLLHSLTRPCQVQPGLQRGPDSVQPAMHPPDQRDSPGYHHGRAHRDPFVQVLYIRLAHSDAAGTRVKPY